MGIKVFSTVTFLASSFAFVENYDESYLHMKYKMSLVFKCFLKKQPTPPFPSKEIVMNSIFISSKSHPNLRVTTFLLILINSKGLMVNTGFFFVRLIHKFSESISVKAGSNFPYLLNLDQNSVVS